ncbi:MAG TPA: hypothetical protein VH107_11875, partial [Lacipirellulaceae bacterium]|nr:hypothetical protein [Lacipirellulaceae bacterium]
MDLQHTARTGTRERNSLSAVPRQHLKRFKQRLAICSAIVGCLAVWGAQTDGQTLRVVNYNIDQDTGSSGVPGSDMTTVLQAIGNEHLAGNAQPIDVLALEELYGTPSTTLQPIVAAL